MHNYKPSPIQRHYNCFDNKLGCRRETVRVIECFAKSLKIIRNGILEKGVNPY